MEQEPILKLQTMRFHSEEILQTMLSPSEVQMTFPAQVQPLSILPDNSLRLAIKDTTAFRSNSPIYLFRQQQLGITEALS